MVSLDGTKAIELVSFGGIDRIANRDAFGYYFSFCTAFGADHHYVGVIFSGISLLTATPESVGVAANNKDLNFIHFAEAAIGDHLDEVGIPEFTPGGSVPLIEALSDRFAAWTVRPAADDETVEDYIRSRLYWAWKFEHERVLFTTPDLIRLKLTLQQFMRVVSLGADTDWHVEPTGADVFLSPSKALLLTEKEKRRSAKVSAQSQAFSAVTQFVDSSRIDELRSIQTTQFDLRRLVRLCEELNVCWENHCLHATAMVTRSIIDHVPPIFGFKTFDAVASNYAGSKSFKESMQHLSGSARKIADAHLHVQVRAKEVLPTRTQVDFSRDLDVLLSEVVRLLS